MNTTPTTQKHSQLYEAVKELNRLHDIVREIEMKYSDINEDDWMKITEILASRAIKI